MSFDLKIPFPYYNSSKWNSYPWSSPDATSF
jgi:hypothetical protein